MPKKINDYTIRITNHLFERISKHIYLLRCLKKSDSSKQEWLVEAIKEKLKTLENEQSTEKCLHLRFDPELWQEFEKTIESLKIIYPEVSKKALIEEAIFEKLDREEQFPKEYHERFAREYVEG